MKNASFVALVALASIFSASLCSCGKKVEATKAPDVRVQTLAVQPSDIVGGRVYSGTVEESAGSTISFAAAGTIQQMLVSPGDRVAAGQLIATLDPSSLRHAYDIAKATLAEAQDAYNRMKQLHDANSLSDMKWVEIENTLAQARSAEAIAKKALDDAQLKAPVSGYVSEKFADVGMVAAPGVPVAKIVKINPVKVNISIPENEIATMRQGTEATMTVGALGGRTFTGKVTEKGVAANPITRSYDLKITVANTDNALLPGMICDVTLDTGTPETEQAIVLPTGAVLLDSDNSNFVWLKDKGHAVKRIVEVGGMTDNGLVIKSGLAAGDSVIVAGQQKVSQGTAVVAVN